MKFKKFLSAAFICLAVGGAFASCSSDDDNDGGNQTLATPKYEEDAALFNIDSKNCPYSSIELTAAGNYIVIPSEMVNYAPEKLRFITKAAASRSVSIIEGKYTKIDDNTYDLEGFGTITVTMTGDTAASLDMSLDNGQNYTLRAERQTQYPDSKMTNNLCRTWKITHIQMIIKVNNHKMFDKKVSIDHLEDLFKSLAQADPDFDGEYDDEDFDIDDYPEKVIFSKAGTYMVLYADNSLAVSTWGWDKESEGLLRYSWDYEHLYDPDYSGVVTIAFPGNNSMTLKESYVENENGEIWDQTCIWTFAQV